MVKGSEMTINREIALKTKKRFFNRKKEKLVDVIIHFFFNFSKVN
jgi:hypothetical protein